MIDSLLTALAAVALLQPRDRRGAALVFAGCALGFDVTCRELPGDAYFLGAAATDALCLWMLRQWDTGGLQRLCLISICLNFAGWVAYASYLPAAPYETAFTIYYLAAILYLFIGGLCDGVGKKCGYRSRFSVNPR